jgi:hypothetical protein
MKSWLAQLPVGALGGALSPRVFHAARASASAVWDQARHELLYLTWALMEVALITPISLALMGWARYWPPGQVTLWLLLTLLTSFNLLRLVSVLRLSAVQRHLVMLTGLLVMLLLASSLLLYHARALSDFRWLAAFWSNLNEKGNQLWLRDVSVFLLTLLMWSRGGALLNRSFAIEKIGLFLRVGGLIIAPLVIWLGRLFLSWSVASFLLLFFAAGLTAVALVRVEELEKRQSGFSASLRPRWLGAVLAASLLTVFTAGTLATMLSGQRDIVVLGWLAPLWQAIMMGTAVVVVTLLNLALPFLQLFGAFLALLVALFGGALTSWLGALPGVSDPYETGQILTLDDLAQLTRSMGLGSKIIIFAVILLLFLLIMVGLERLHRRIRLRYHPSERALRQTAEQSTGGLVDKVWRRLGRLARWRTAASIRHIYAQMSRAAAAHGYARSLFETPYEYRQTLARVWPNHETDVQLITEAYVKIRYGELPESDAEVAAIRQAWRRLEQAKPVTLVGRQPANP